MSCLSFFFFFIKEMLFYGGLGNNHVITRFLLDNVTALSHRGWDALFSPKNQNKRVCCWPIRAVGDPRVDWALLSSLCPTWGTERTIGNVGLPCVTERRGTLCPGYRFPRVRAFLIFNASKTDFRATAIPIHTWVDACGLMVQTCSSGHIALTSHHFRAFLHAERVYV